MVIPIESRRSAEHADDPVHGQIGDDHPGGGSAIDDTTVDSTVARMLAAISIDPAYDRAALCACIEAVQECATAAMACADACLGEEMVEELTACIRTLMNAADVCEVTARVLSRRTGPDRALTRALLSACWAACRRAREVCEEFLPIHDHCRVCARACRTAERTCRALLASADAGGPHYLRSTP